MNHPRLSLALAVATAALAVAAGPASPASATPHPQAGTGAVFVQTNDLDQNAVQAYTRAADGSLTSAGTYATGGKGGAEAGAVVDPLASQGSVTLDRRHDLLFVVNAGSDSLTVFGVDGSRLWRRQVVSSHGDFPVSVSVAGDLVYVLNARGGGSISGYRLSGRTLVHLDGSTRPLSLVPNGNPEFLQAPSQVAVSPDRHAVVVATKTHGTLLSFALTNGRPSASPVVTTSGAVPFALTYDRAGRLLVVDASGLVTSYRVGKGAMLAKLSQVGPTGQAAACWSVLVHGQLYVANAGSNSISAVADHGGMLTLTDATAAATDAGPVDLAASRHGRYLYQLSGATGNIDAFRVAPDGTLTRIGTTPTGLGSANHRATEGIAAA